MDRRFVFKHYWWIAPALGAVAIGIAIEFGGADRMALIGSAVAGTLAFCYFVHQQKLAETVLFHQLFTAFNTRYDALNGKLSSIPPDAHLTEEQSRWVADYFNLCAEEYHFYELGYIPANVWRSWCRGMAWHLRRPKMREVWNDAMQTDSFYGLTTRAILTGAGYKDGEKVPGW
ncbi:hypothetical protein [Acidovorax sp. sic0104]|uniref:hypothetical protein n=1 Tax=Acidovorax sp. sic0104 TaxID=2854784 RepID=UPI001C43CAA9|nr:hypothetical protein [Acidovorax sp. sic0104]MBV7541966.1 hypothetical protein [Acidovorax sp. sic0104]